MVLAAQVKSIHTLTCVHSGTLFYGTNQNQMLNRQSFTDFGRGNVDHTVRGFSGKREVREVSQGQFCHSATVYLMI